MKITSIRVGKLVTGPGYNNQRCEAEALVEDGETPEAVAEELGLWCDNQIRREREVADLARDCRRLIEEVSDLKGLRDQLAGEVKGYRAAVDKYEELGQLAREKGLKGADLLPGNIPF